MSTESESPNINRLIKLVQHEPDEDTNTKNEIVKVLKRGGYSGEAAMNLLRRTCFQLHLTMMAWDNNEVKPGETTPDAIKHVLGD